MKGPPASPIKTFFPIIPFFQLNIGCIQVNVSLWWIVSYPVQILLSLPSQHHTCTFFKFLYQKPVRIFCCQPVSSPQGIMVIMAWGVCKAKVSCSLTFSRDRGNFVVAKDPFQNRLNFPFLQQPYWFVSLILLLPKIEKGEVEGKLTMNHFSLRGRKLTDFFNADEKRLLFTVNW